MTINVFNHNNSIIFPAFFGKLYCQSLSQFLKPIVKSDSELTQSQLNQKQIIENNPLVESWQYVEIGNLSSFISSDGVLSIQLPTSSDTLDFKLKYARTALNGDYVWIGDLITPQFLTDGVTEDEAFWGTIKMIKTGERIFGEIRMDTVFYQIKCFGNNLNALIELDYEKYKDFDLDCGMVGSAPIEQTNSEVTERSGACP